MIPRQLGDPLSLSVMDQWQTWMTAAGLADRTIGDRIALLRRCAIFAGKVAHELTRDDLVRFLARPGLKPTTRDTYYSALHAYHEWLVACGLRQSNPLDAVPRPRVPQGLPRPLSTEQVRQVLRIRMWASTRAMILMMAYQGLRVHEVAHQRGEDVDRLGGTLTVRGKGGSVAVLPLHPMVAGIADRLPGRGWWFPSPQDSARHVQRTSVSAGVSRVMARAGVDGTAHQLRHWFATELVRSGADLRTVQRLLRHKSLQTTQRYVAVADESLSAALDGLPVVV